MAKLIYRVPFEYLSMKPIVDDRTLRSMKVKKGARVDDATEMIPTTTGLECTLKRSEASDEVDQKYLCNTADDCYVEAITTNFPQDIRYFKIQAVFELPTCDISSDYRWAMVLFVRTGDEFYSPIRNQRTTVTLQSRMDGGVRSARMNHPCGAPVGSEPGPGTGLVTRIPDGVYADIFDPKTSPRSAVALELLVDRKSGVARAGLEARRLLLAPQPPSGERVYRRTRWFVHPLVSWDEQHIESIGLGIANSIGLGTTTVRVRDFRIYQLSIIDLWVAKMSDWISNLLGRR